MIDFDSLWNKIITADGVLTGNSVWDQVKKQIRLIGVGSGQAIFLCPNKGVVTVAQSRQSDICVALSKETQLPVYRLLFEISKETVTRSSASTKQDILPASQGIYQYEPTIDELCLQSGLISRHTFDNFAVSSCNNVAFAAAQVVANQAGKVYNPLFIWGGVGVGKTHLTQAIGRKILQLKSTKKVYFCAGDKFTNEIIESIRNRSTDKFRNKYRKLDVLIVDDIQFISGKNTVQEEFFHTFNELVTRGAQVILISDRPPHLIQDIEDRLRSRFSGGLIVDISPPDFELRTAIVLIKSRERSIEIDIEAAKEIAQNSKDNRSIEGTLLSVYANMFASSSGQSPKIQREDVFKYLKRDVGSSQGISPEQTIDIVCSYYQIKSVHIKQQNRVGRIARARQVIMYILREKMLLNYESIARMIRRKDHTTIMHGVNKIKQDLIHNQILKNDIDIICKNIGLADHNI
jgi:chromosomal replication initiator protein